MKNLFFEKIHKKCFVKLAKWNKEISRNMYSNIQQIKLQTKASQKKQGGSLQSY